MNQPSVKPDKDYDRMTPEQIQSALLRQSRFQSEQLAQQTSTLKSINNTINAVIIIIILAAAGMCVLSFLLMS